MNDMQHIKILLLAAGDSTRFWPLPDKHGVKFFGKPLIYHTISQFLRFGFTSFIIVTNEANQSFFQRVKEDYKNANIDLVLQRDSLGMAGAVVSAAPLIADHPVLIVNPSDIVEDALLSDFVSKYNSKVPASIAGIFIDSYFPGGYLRIQDGFVSGIVEKPKPDEVPSQYVALVFDYFSKGEILLDAIKGVNVKTDDIFERAIQKLIDSGVQCTFLPYTGFWGYLKYPWHVLSVMPYFLGKIKGQTVRSKLVDKTAIILGDVVIEEDVRVLEYSKIIGPSYIGSGTVIGNHTVIRESMIGSSCVIGHASEITRSYIGDNSWFHRNYLGDSVISDYVSFGSGVTTANFRIDEKVILSEVNKGRIETGRTKLGTIIGKNVKVGVNVSIMPGRKIGGNCLIGAGILVNQDIPDNSFCELSSVSFSVKKNRIQKPTGENMENRKKLKLG